MKLIDNLKVRNKFTLMLVFPIFGLLYFAIAEIVSESNMLSEMEKIEKLAVYGVKASNLVHEMQKERGMTAGFLGSKGKNFAGELPDQRANVDKRLAELKAFLSSNDVKEFGGEQLSQDVNLILNRLGNLASKREGVTALTIAAKDAIGYYTGTNTELLKSAGQVAALSSNVEVTKLASAYVNFLLAKERAGIERAVLTSTFAADKFAAGNYEKLLSLITIQDTYLSVFKSFASPDQSNFLAETLKGPDVSEVKRLRSVATSSQKGWNIKSSHWFQVSTGRIELLKKIEDKLAEDLSGRAVELSATANANFISALTIALVAASVTFVFAFLVVRGVTGPLSDALVRMKDIAEGEGDLTKRIEVKSTDEVGQLCSAANDFI